MLAVRVWFTSFNPIFTDFLYNNMATAVGVILSLYLFIQDWRTPIISSTDLPSKKIHHEESERYPGVVVTGLGFGALLFLTLLLFGDVSVVSRWAVAPYPDRGPYPYPWRYVSLSPSLPPSLSPALPSHPPTLTQFHTTFLPLFPPSVSSSWRV